MRLRLVRLRPGLTFQREAASQIARFFADAYARAMLSDGMAHRAGVRTAPLRPRPTGPTTTWRA